MSEGLPEVSKSWFQRLRVRQIAAVAGTLLLGYGAASTVAAQSLAPILGPRYNVADPSVIGGHYAAVNFRSTDGVLLQGWIFQGSGQASIDQRRSVILVHGLQSNRATSPQRQFAQALLAGGYDVLVFDLRGQGDSENAPVTLGDKERYDVLGAYKFMKSVGYSAGKMTIIGVSMGGDAEILASKQMPDVGAMIVISSYAELEPLVRHQLAQQNPALVALEPGIKLYAKAVWGMDLGVSPVNVIRSEPDRAFLVVQGLDDGFVTPSNAQQLYSASKNPQTQEILVPGVGHELESISPKEEKLVEAEIQKFIDQQLAERQQVS